MCKKNGSKEYYKNNRDVILCLINKKIILSFC